MGCVLRRRSRDLFSWLGVELNHNADVGGGSQGWRLPAFQPRKALITASLVRSRCTRHCRHAKEKSCLGRAEKGKEQNSKTHGPSRIKTMHHGLHRR